MKKDALLQTEVPNESSAKSLQFLSQWITKYKFSLSAICYCDIIPVQETLDHWKLFHFVSTWQHFHYQFCDGNNKCMQFNGFCAGTVV